MPEPSNRLVAQPAIRAAALASAFNAACVVLESDGRQELANFLKGAVREHAEAKPREKLISLLVPDFADSVNEAILEIANGLEQPDWGNI